MEGINHSTVRVNGIDMHYAEMGGTPGSGGPLILFLHGFPECWYTWRHQMTFMASQGYRVIAPDLRGFADTTGPPTDDATKFTPLHIVGDIVELLNTVAADQDKVFVVGHDWGAVVAWALCMYRPDKVKALVNMSVAFSPRNPKRKPIDTLRAVYGNDYYVLRFQEPGDIEAEFEKIGTKRVLQHFLTYRNPAPLMLPKGNAFGEQSNDQAPIAMPSWISEEEVDYYATEYQKAGFTGALNLYRSIDINWELTAAWTNAQVKVPVKFIVGDLDITYNAPGAKDFLHNGGMKKYVPLLEDIVVLKDAGHFLHEEKPDEINRSPINFFVTFLDLPSDDHHDHDHEIIRSPCVCFSSVCLQIRRLIKRVFDSCMAGWN